MSQPTFSSLKTEAHDTNIWKVDLTPNQQKSLDRVSQIEVRLDEARWKLQKDKIVTWVAVLVAVALLTAVFIACFYAIATQRDPREAQPAWAILSSMVAGVFSYLAGKAAR